MTNPKKIHFMGIGGAGQSSIARIAKSFGYEVSGCDLEESKEILRLKADGITVSIGHSEDHVKDVDILAHTPAVFYQNANHPEYLSAKKADKAMIGEEFMAKYLLKDKFLIAISGTHGKGTTSSFVSLVMEQAGLDPTCEIGTLLIDWGKKNYRVGKSKYFVIEADEFREKFLMYHPNIAIVTSIEHDHPECFKDLDAVVDAFYRFALGMQEPKIMVVYKGQEGTKKLGDRLKGWDGKLIWYEDVIKQSFKLKLPGKHMKEDASAALTLAKVLDIPFKKAKEAVQSFSGNDRRFEFRGEYNGAKIYDDYAHHPTAVARNLEGARELYPNRRLIAVFQPHMFSRMQSMLDEFAKALGMADIVVLTDVFSRREQGISKPDSNDLAGRIGSKAVNAGNLDSLLNHLKQTLSENDVVLVMGAGDVYKVSDQLVNSKGVL